MEKFRIYNTISGEKEIFLPRKKKRVNMFVCGPTVYDFSHLGHARTYIFYDMLAKYLKSKRFSLFYLQNITDVDDKIIQRAKEKNTDWKKIASKFEKKYKEDVKKLKITSVSKYARATEHIKEIKSQVKRLMEKGFAYEIEGDGIYFDISKFDEYGKLSKRTASQAEDAVSRIDEAGKKRNKGDFCLWKFSKKGEPKWKSEWGWGRPGWHIEDTAITEKYFGAQYDLHGGARDLIFPHHEAEITQMESLSGKKPMVKYWVHTGFLTVNGQKMSKSLGNFITIRDFLKQHKASVLRFIVFSSHYRSPLDYSEKFAMEAEKNIAEITNFLAEIKRAKKGYKKNPQEQNKKYEWLSEASKDFENSLLDDFNTPKAKAAIFKIISTAKEKIRNDSLSPREANYIWIFFKKVNSIFGFIDYKDIRKKFKIPKEVIILAKKREKMRSKKNWQEADKIREEIKELGYSIEDSEKGYKIKKLG